MGDGGGFTAVRHVFSVIIVILFIEDISFKSKIKNEFHVQLDGDNSDDSENENGFVLHRHSIVISEIYFLVSCQF